MCEEEFQYIKEYLENVLHLLSFDPCSDPYITVDASNTGLGAVLSQKNTSGKENILFASRFISPTEEKYPIIEREALACTWALDHFRAFIGVNL